MPTTPCIVGFVVTVMVPVGMESAMLKVIVISTSGQLRADTLTLAVDVPAAAGVPVILPVASILMPEGRDAPSARAKVQVMLLLAEAASCAVRDSPFVPFTVWLDALIVPAGTLSKIWNDSLTVVDVHSLAVTSRVVS